MDTTDIILYEYNEYTMDMNTIGTILNEYNK